MVIGNILDAQFRRSDVDWTHAVQDATAMVRDYIKWDDTPVSLTHFAESAMRAYKVAMTPPYGPVVLVADAVLQEEPIPAADRQRLRVPKLTQGMPPGRRRGRGGGAGEDAGRGREPAHHRRAAARTPKGLALLIELAELLQAPVQDARYPMRMNFPSRHPLKMGSGVPVGDADLVLGLEHPELFMNLNALSPVNRIGMQSRPLVKPGTKIATINASELITKSNYQDAAGTWRPTWPSPPIPRRRSRRSSRRAAG